MADMTITQMSPQTEPEYKAAIEQCLVQMKRLREQINQEQAEIDRLKAETRAILMELKAA